MGSAIPVKNLLIKPGKTENSALESILLSFLVDGFFVCKQTSFCALDDLIKMRKNIA